jgi:hypothetical protein
MVKCYQYWDKGYNNMPLFIKKIYDHNKKMSLNFNFDLILLDDDNISSYMKLPDIFYKLKPNFKSDIIRWNILNENGGIWLDTDIIIIKNLNDLFENINDKNLAILDIEYNYKIGCCSLVMKNNSICTNFCVNKLNEKIEKNKNLDFDWNDLGPNIVTEMYQNFKDNIILNSHDKVIKGCNFICWNDVPGINKQKWYLDLPENAKNKAEQIINNNECYYVITWTIYRMNDDENIIDKVFNDEKSVFYYLIN